MLRVYINYPNPHATCHVDPGCAMIRMHRKQSQRIRRLNSETLSSEFANLDGDEYAFGSYQALNDMWLELDFGDPVFERALAAHLIRRMSRRYTPFARVTLSDHC